MFKRLSVAFLIAACAVTGAEAQDSLSTTFSSAEFATGSTADVTLVSDSGSFSALFSGGIQEQAFHGPAYSDSNDAYFFVNGTFTGSFGRDLTGTTDDEGTITFSAGGVDNVSFFAGDFANGVPTLSVFGVDGSALASGVTITPALSQFSFDSATLGQRIGQVQFFNAGPAANAPYVIAIDGFTASVAAVPEPASGAVVALIFAAIGMRRRTNRS